MLFITLVEYAMICELEAKYIFIKSLSVKIFNYIHFLLHSSFNGNKRLSSIEDDVIMVSLLCTMQELGNEAI